MEESIKTLVVILLFIGSYLSYRYKPSLRSVMLFTNFLFFGVYTGYFVSILHIYQLITFKFFSWLNTPSFFVFILIAIFSHFLLGRFFCGWICPFGIINWYLKKIRDFLKIPFNFLQGRFLLIFYFKFLFLFIGLILILKGNFFALSLEPFFKYSILPPILFKRIWFLTLLILNFFIPYFWCRYICFSGAFFKILSYLSMTKYIFKCRHKDCKICIQICPKGIITLQKNVIQSECIRCLECQKCKEHKE